MNRAEELSIAFLKTQPEGAARVLEQLPSKEAASFISEAPVPESVAVLGRMQRARAADVLSHCEPERAVVLLTQIDSHARSLLLRALPTNARDAMLAAAPKRQASMLRRHLDTNPNAVGAWMDAPKATFTPDSQVGACLDQIRRLGSQTRFRHLRDRRCPAAHRNELISKRCCSPRDSAPLSGLMQRDPPTLSQHASISSVASLPAWDTMLTMPVTDRHDRLIGVLHFDSVREGMTSEVTSTAGVDANIVLLHLMQTFLVCLSGLLNTALTKSDIMRMSPTRED